jgi:hypothetical protein
MAAGGEQMFGNILLGSRGGVVSASLACTAAVWSAAVVHAGKLVVCIAVWSACLMLLALQAAGSLKVSPSGLVWKRSGGGRTVEVPAAGMLLEAGCVGVSVHEGSPV